VSWGGVGKRIAVIAVTLLFTSAAIAQVIPPSEQLGRKRERFAQPPAPQAQPEPGAISLPSTFAPVGATSTPIVIRDVRPTAFGDLPTGIRFLRVSHDVRELKLLALWYELLLYAYLEGICESSQCLSPA